MKQLLTLVLAGVFHLFHSAQAQEPAGSTRRDSTRLAVTSHTLLSTDQVPFWLEMNRLGRVDDESPVQQLFVFDWQQALRNRQGKPFFDYGLTMTARIGEQSKFYPEQYWGRFTAGSFYFLAGAKAEPVWAGGLSHTNGDLFQSNNARPLPRGELGLEKFSPFSSGWLSRFSVDARYAEYLLTDDRYIDHAQLHHKKAVINYAASEALTVHVGLDHWVFWGGRSPDPEIGKIPGFKYYLRYVLGLDGGSDSPDTDQQNIAGNQLGQSLIGLDLSQPGYELKVYYQHLFEDGSGFVFHNMQDGFWGISLRQLKKDPFIERLVVEFVNTTDQSGQYHKNEPGTGAGEGRDDYFTHGVYHSGFVAYNRMMGSPLFIPKIADGISQGFESTRLRAIHGGISGYLSPQVNWEGKGTYARYYGNYEDPFPRYRDLISLEAGLHVRPKQKPISYGFRLGTDLGRHRYIGRSFGCEFSLQYQIR